jgi:HD-GYP domain-containing protein (c-di-GMP phosphodiesterase class II)
MDISAALATARDMTGFVDLLVEHADGLVPFDAFMLSLADPAGESYAVWRGERDGRPAYLVEGTLPVSHGLPGWVIRTSERLVLDGYTMARLAVRSPGLDIDQAQGILALPLIGDQGETFGSLLFLSQNESPYGREHLPLVSVLAALVASSVRQTLQSQEFTPGDDFVFSLARAIEAKDPYTEGHGGRVAEYAFALGKRAGLVSAELKTLFKGGFLHDVGKIGINDSVLFKEGALTDAEYAHMKLHPEIGAQLLQVLPASDPLIPMIRHHHERWDGRGYPDGLQKDEPCLMARIVSIADAFDAMTSTRCYRPAMPVARSLDILREHRGTQWDPELVSLFVELVEQRLQETGAARFSVAGAV